MQNQNADFSLKMPKKAQGSVILSMQGTRMGGGIAHICLPNGQEAFLKNTSNFERIELLREHKSLQTLNGKFPVPNILDFQDDGITAQILLEKVSGRPLHEMIQEWDRSKILSVVTNILQELWNVTPDVLSRMPRGLEEELQDINALLERDLINIDNFKLAAEGRHPLEVYQQAQEILHSRQFNVLSHGDFCLPNILVTEQGKWTLIDWGKGGLSDRFRDLSSIEGSLERNIDEKAYPELLKQLNVVETPEQIKEKTLVYDWLDLFWYNAELNKVQSNVVPNPAPS